MASESRFPQVGEVFEDRYQVERVIGRGGFSRVYLARQIDLDRPVALKVLNPDSEKIPEGTRLDVIVDRFDREARTISKFKDSHTVVMHDYGRTDQDLLYMVLEFVDGMNLRQLVGSEGAIEPKRVTFMLRQILSSLQEAHAFGVLHRDIKPQNIMVYEHVGRKDQVKVLDFGIAKTFSEEQSRDTKKLTVQGNIVGTPRYMSPEQLRGDIKLGPPSDIYSLGLVAYELLVGQKVAAELSGLHVVERHLNAEPITLPDELDIPGGLRSIVNGMLAKSVTNRYADTSEVLEALEDWKADAVAEPRGTIPERKDSASDQSNQTETESRDTVMARAVTADSADAGQATPAERSTMHIRAPSSAKQTVKMPAGDLASLASDTADTVADRPSPASGAAADESGPLLTVQDALADTVPDRPALAADAGGQKASTSGNDSREFEAPKELARTPQEGSLIANVAKAAAILILGSMLAYGGWYASQHVRTAGASVDEPGDEPPAADDESAGPVDTLAAIAPPTETETGDTDRPAEGRIEAMTAAVSIASAVGHTSWEIAGHPKMLAENEEVDISEELPETSTKEPPKRSKRTTKRSPKKRSEKPAREPAKAKSDEGEAEPKTRKLKPLDRLN